MYLVKPPYWKRVHKAHPQLKECVLFLPFNDVTGTHARDLMSTAAGVGGSSYSGLVPVNLSAYKAILIDGSDDLRYNTGSASLNSAVVAEGLNANQGALEFWIRPNWDGDDGLNHGILAWRDGVGLNRIIFDKTGADLRFYIKDKDAGTHYVTYNVSSSWTAGAWYHVVATWDFNADSMVLYESGIQRDNTPVSALSSDSIDAIGSFYVGSWYTSDSQFDGLIYGRILDRPLTAAEITALNNSGDGHLNSTVVDPDTKWRPLFEKDSPDAISWTFGQKISSISTVTLTTANTIANQWVDNDPVVVSDDANPPNSVQTAINGTPSGTTITVDDSCAAVTGTNKFISRNLIVDGDQESPGVGSISDGAIPGTITPAKDTTEVHKDSQSLELVWLAGNDNDEIELRDLSLVNGSKYYYRFWSWLESADPSLALTLDVDGSANVLTREFGKALGNNGFFDRTFDLDGAYDVSGGDIYDVGVGDFSASIWVRTSDASTLYQIILIKGSIGSSVKGYGFVSDAGIIKFVYNDGTLPYGNSSHGANSVSDGNLHHIAARWDRSGNLEGFIDGVSVGTWAINATDIDNAGVLRSGLNVGGGRFEGSIVDVKIYVGGLWSEAEILYQYEHPFDLSAGVGTLTDAWWCTDNAGNTTVTSQAGGTNLTANANTNIFALKNWKMHEGIFTADQTGSHKFNVKASGEGAGANDATIYMDDLEVRPLVAGNALVSGRHYTLMYNTDTGVTGAEWSGIGADATELAAGDLYVRIDKTEANTADITAPPAQIVPRYGTIYGAKWVPGKDGPALRFDGTDYIDCGSDDDLNITGPITIEVEIKTSDTGTQYLACKMDGANDGYSMGIVSQHLYMSVDDGNKEGTVDIVDGLLHRLHATYDGSDIKLYVDGVLDVTETIGSKTMDTWKSLFIGQLYDQSARFTGDMGHVLFHNRALSAGEVKERCKEPYKVFR